MMEKEQYSAFWRGFWQGLSAPAQVFEGRGCDFEPMYRARILNDDAQALRGDWVRVGNALRVALNKHGEDS